jgi:superfamily II DNA or RNA helicase
MSRHDIIDNRHEKLVEHINRILGTTASARFAVGYFFLSGLEAIAKPLSSVKEVRLLIGNTTNRETLEQIAEGYRRLDLLSEAAEEQAYPKRTEKQRMADETAANIRNAVELMDQTDEAEELVKTLVQLIEEKRLNVKVYTKGRLHAKAYVFTYGKVFDRAGKTVARQEDGIAIVGSSNLTLSGVTHNTELNVVVHGNENHAKLVDWFDELWKEADEFDESLMREMQQSWAVHLVRPYDIYMKTLYALVRDRLETEDERELMWDDEIYKTLADFQKTAFKQVVQIIRDNGGGFVADVVGLGKSFIGAAIVKHFERTDHARPLIICPAALVEMWERYDEIYELNARVLSMGYLREEDDGSPNFLLQDVKYRDRDFILVDESHNFRHSETQRYRILQAFLSAGKRCCFLTATPRNKSAWDVYNQIKLFHQDDKTNLPVDPPNLKEYFRLIERGDKKLPDILVNILVRRTRNHILRWYGFDSETHQPIDASEFKAYLDGRRRAYVIVAGKHQFFPKRELDTIDYSIEDTYQGLYQQLRGYLGQPRKKRKPGAEELAYARYGLWNYVREEKKKQEPYVSLHRAGANLHGLMRVLLFKRFESSVYAFKETIRRLLKVHDSFLAALDQGIVPAGQDAQKILYESDYDDQSDLLDALRGVSQRYNADDFESEKLRAAIEHDIRLLRKIQKLVDPISPEQDAKLQKLKERLNAAPLKKGKCLIFSQYADTARYLFENLNPNGRRDDIEVIFSGDKSTARVVGRFAPKANPEYKFVGDESELSTVVATDVLSEGLNLQDCDKMINYDLHWNPVRLIQRFGRIDRIGSEHEKVYGFNFLPETGLDKNLGLKEKLHNRIQEIHETIGEDAKILDQTEELNEEAMYAIYDSKAEQLSLFEDEKEELLDLNEAEEILRQLRSENPVEYERITQLRDGIRSARDSAQKGMFVFCQMGRFQQLFLIDSNGGVTSKDVPRVLGAIKCGADEKISRLPADYNAALMKIKSRFAEDAKHRRAELEHTVSLTHGQRYVLRELGVIFRTAEDDELKAQINILEKAFRSTRLSHAVKREINLCRRNAMTGANLVKELGRIYLQHNLREAIERQRLESEDRPVPQIICSEALT